MKSEIGMPARLAETHHPLLYEINTRILLHELSEREGYRVTLNGVPDDVLDSWAEFGFDAVWLMGVWSTGPLGREKALNDPHLQNEYNRNLPGWTPGDVGSSPYSISEYAVSRDLGGDEGLISLRKRLAARGMGLILDFVANHTARDGNWVTTHPEYYVCGTAGDDGKTPEMFFKARTKHSESVLALGWDPAFPAWTDTAQLDIRSSETRRALKRALSRVAGMCDGVRCDMAMLLLSDVFSRTWGRIPVRKGEEEATGEFWKEAIASVRRKHRGFLFIAEAYWHREWDLQQLGFDFTYDKVLYDRLLREGASSTRAHLKAEAQYQTKSVRFIENHDEQRAAHVFHSEDWHCAAAVVMSTIPGMALVHDGQLEGRTIRVPVQLLRRPRERGSHTLWTFYRRLLSCVAHPVFRKGEWTMLPARPAWHDNPTWENFFIFYWSYRGEGARMVVVNSAPHSGQCYATIPEEHIGEGSVELRDLMGDAVYVREKAVLLSKGMYFDLSPYGLHIFDIKPQESSLLVPTT